MTLAMSSLKATKKKIRACITAIILLVAMLVITTSALIASFVSVEDSIFEMGVVKIDLNGGQTIFDGSDWNVEPGRSVKKDFTLRNNSTVDVYYRLYLENVTGSLQECLTFEIYDGDQKLYSGRASEMTKENPAICEDTMAAGETRTLTAVVKMDENAGNQYQNGNIFFDFTADAVQARNNPDKDFS